MAAAVKPVAKKATARKPVVKSAVAPNPVTVELELEKETPGTYKFKEVPVSEGAPVIVGAQYVKKSYFGDFKPKGITVTIKAW